MWFFASINTWFPYHLALMIYILHVLGASLIKQNVSSEAFSCCIIIIFIKCFHEFNIFSLYFLLLVFVCYSGSFIQHTICPARLGLWSIRSSSRNCNLLFFMVFKNRQFDPWKHISSLNNISIVIWCANAFTDLTRFTFWNHSFNKNRIMFDHINTAFLVRQSSWILLRN